MSNPDLPDPLEERLRVLRPAPLPPALLNRLLAAEPPPVRHRSLRFWSVTVPLGALAVVFLTTALVARYPRPAPPPTPVLTHQSAGPQPSDFRVYLPADRRSTLLDVSEGTLVDAGPEHQIRLVRAVWLDDTTYIGDDHSTLHRQTARAEIIPVALNTY